MGREHPRQKRRDSDSKEYVKMFSIDDCDGERVPLLFRTESSDDMFRVRIRFSEPGVSLAAGGQGFRYACDSICKTNDGMVYIKPIDLYHDGDFWFVERDQLSELLAVPNRVSYKLKLVAVSDEQDEVQDINASIRRR